MAFIPASSQGQYVRYINGSMFAMDISPETDINIQLTNVTDPCPIGFFSCARFGGVSASAKPPLVASEGKDPDSLQRRARTPEYYARAKPRVPQDSEQKPK
jgi:hypothetical protein